MAQANSSARQACGEEDQGNRLMREEALEQAAALDHLGIDLAEEKATQRLLIPRSALLRKLILTLASETQHPLLVGEPGVGKTALVYQLAKVLARDHEAVPPEALRGRKVILVTSMDLVAGALYVNQLEHKLKMVIDNLSRQRALLFLDDLPAFVGPGASTEDPSGDISNILLPSLKRGHIKVIAATTHDGWKRTTMRNPALGRLFIPIEVPAATRAETLKVLWLRARADQRRLAIPFGHDALEEFMGLAEHLHPWRCDPGRSVHLFDACRPACLHGRGRNRGENAAEVRPFDRQDVRDAVGRTFGLPPFIIDLGRPVERCELIRFVESHIVGQVEPVKSVIERILMVQARLCATRRPLGTFLFAGPTGVGKTLLARTVAKLMLGDERRLARFDMSEFGNYESVGDFIGSKAITAAQRPGLVDAAWNDPFPVILLDEIEKAHPDVFHVLLQVLGEGRLTDHRGRTACFNNALIFMTTNLGANRGFAQPGRSAAVDLRERTEAAVRAHFRPEFVNRLTDVLIFQPLDTAALATLLRRELCEFGRRAGLAARGVRFRVDRAAFDLLLRKGHCPEYGARPMERAVDRLVGGALAEYLVRHPMETHGQLAIGVRESTEELHVLSRLELEVTHGR